MTDLTQSKELSIFTVGMIQQFDATTCLMQHGCLRLSVSIRILYDQTNLHLYVDHTLLMFRSEGSCNGERAHVMICVLKNTQYSFKNQAWTGWDHCI